MKKMFLLMVASCALLSNVAFASESTLTRSIKEIDAVIHSDELVNLLPAEDHLIYIKKHDLGYKIETNLHKLQANIQYEAPDIFGNENIRVGFFFVD